MTFLEVFYTFDWILMFLLGLICLLWGIDRLFARIPVIGTGPTSDIESTIIRALGIIGGIVGFLTPILIAIENFAFDNANINISWFSTFLFVLGALILIARPLKEIPIAAFIALFVGVILVALVIFLAGTDIVIFSIHIPLWVILTVIALLDLIVLILAYRTEKAMDYFLGFISWSPFLIIIGVLLTIQAVFMVIYPHSGLSTFVS